MEFSIQQKVINMMMRLKILTLILPLFLFSLVATTTLAKDDQSFECVDIYKQPSLLHPLLKNHKLQITEQNQTRRSSTCPRGMVPIHKSRNNVNNSLIAQDAVNWATLDTKIGSVKYNGASGILSIHNPKPFSGKSTRSLLLIGDHQEFNCIQVGWAVNPELYGDSQTHLTTYWTSDGAGSTGCYNAACKGFIQTSSNIYPGMVLEPARGGDQLVLNLYIVRDKDSGNWVLFYNGVKIGYWPKELLPTLESGAALIRYGAVSVGGAPMGNGEFPDGGYDLSKSSYFKEMGFVDGFMRTMSIKYLDMTVNTPKPDCYKLNYLRDQEIITYGGASCPN